VRSLVKAIGASACDVWRNVDGAACAAKLRADVSIVWCYRYLCVITIVPRSVKLNCQYRGSKRYGPYDERDGDAYCAE
jgi:hypothetical protein